MREANALKLTGTFGLIFCVSQGTKATIQCNMMGTDHVVRFRATEKSSRFRTFFDAISAIKYDHARITHDHPASRTGVNYRRMLSTILT